MTTPPENPTVTRKVFICNNGDCTASENAVEIFEALQILVRDGGYDQYDSPVRLKCMLTGCLDKCKNGPLMVVHPGAVTYQKVDLASLSRIFSQHLLEGEVVQDLLFKMDSEQSTEAASEN